LEGGDLSPAEAVAAEGHGGAADLLRLRGGGAHLPSRPGFQPRPPGNGDFARRAYRRAPHGEFCRLRLGRACGRGLMLGRRSSSYIGTAITRTISVWGLLVLLVLLIIVFSLLKPDTFLTCFNVRSILSNKSVQALVALSVFIPMTANQFDLSAGFNIGISQVLAIGLQAQGLPWWAAVIAVVLMGPCVGLLH